jgi:hypothetical protein
MSSPYEKQLEYLSKTGVVYILDNYNTPSSNKKKYKVKIVIFFYS